MEITQGQYGSVMVIKVEGSLDSSSAPDASAFVEGQIEDGHTNLVIDLSDVTYLSSAGLRFFLVTLQSVRSRGGNLRLAGPNANVRRVLDMSGFSQFIVVFDIAQEAAESFGT